MSNKNITFETWKKMIDAVLEAKYGIDSEMLPDMPYRDWYDAGVTSLAAAKRAIKQAQTY